MAIIIHQVYNILMLKSVGGMHDIIDERKHKTSENWEHLANMELPTTQRYKYVKYEISTTNAFNHMVVKLGH